MYTPQQLLVDVLWVLGLAGALATFSYMSWYRSLRGWRWVHTLLLPRSLAPLCGSLALFALGMALNAALADQPPPWWQTTAWSILALLFAVQFVIYTNAGRRNGWDTPIEENKQP